ncbi:MAG: VWA domain-containing protein [Acidobacteria bacterium]|nr:VWA domain-containing protein [Acidobacteriota bacterium]
MSRRLYPVCAFLFVLVLVGFPVTHAMPQAPSASPAQAPLDLVPVNVHVVDRSGKPVTDLKQADFTVTEDGVPQQVRHFTLQALAPDTSSPDAALTLRSGMTLGPQNRRMFVIALGLGRLEVPSGYISGLLRFVKTRLLPQDQVALFAHDRALSFTTDHQKIAEALERFKKSHEDVDFALGLELGATGMAPLYGNRVLPRKLQTKIDAMVLGPGAKPATPTSAEAIEREAFGGMSLDDFMASSATTLKDHENLMALMEYLRRFDGEKDVLFVTEKGLIWPSDENDRALASIANDARVSIHALQAGGMLAAESGRELNATAQQAMSFRSLRTISDLTGGLAAITENGQAVLDRLDETTRTGYVLGYRASNTAWDGGYRSIDVKVNRPDVTVLFRHGYFRASEIGTFDRRAFVANGRLGAAGNFRREVNDIKVKASASQGGGATLAVEGKIDLSKIKVTTLGGLRVGLLNVAVFCFDSAANPMGTYVQALPLQLSEEEYARFLKSGFPYVIQFPNIRGTQNIRFVVYDFGSDLLGRVDTRVF